MGWIILIVVILIIAWIISVYNGLISSRQKVENAWSQIDVQLQRRFDLIPNFVETVKGYMTHESETFEKIAKYIYHSDLSLRCCAIENMEYVRDEENEDKVILYMTKALNDPARRVALRARKYLKKIKAENN